LRELLKKAAPVFLVLLALYVLGYAAGYISGKQGWVDYKDIQDPPVLKFSRNLEYNVPGYSYLLKQYKAWHDNGRTAYLLQKNAWGMGTLIFVNNFFMANLTMAIRALFVMPVGITILGKFFQGAVFAQAPMAGRMLPVFLMEFGGYFLTIGAVLTLVFWTLFPRRFKFVTRREAARGGLKLFGLAVLLSGGGDPGRKHPRDPAHHELFLSIRRVR
jgi:hypothetical protein